jgi:hypothetical protein
MKIRVGFVSNSSSSSFILNDNEDFETVKDVAEYIIDDNYYDNEKEALKSISNPNTPVFFNTLGDYTYIRKVDDKIVIVTTQNVDFPKICDNALTINEISEEFYRKFDYIDEDLEEMTFDDPNEFHSYYAKFKDFLILKHNILGRHEYIYNCQFCGRRISRGWLLKDGQKICNCSIHKAIRKEKLNKITENESTGHSLC